jgi:hypothetical protein
VVEANAWSPTLGTRLEPPPDASERSSDCRSLRQRLLSASDR